MRHKHSPSLLLILSLVLTQLNFERNGQSAQLETHTSSQIQKSGTINQDQTSIGQDIRDDPANSKASPNLAAQSSSGLAASSCPSSPIAAPTPDDSTFVVDCDGGLDTPCTFHNSGPLVFNLKIKRYVGDVAKLKANGLISNTVRLKMLAFDVDFNGSGGDFHGGGGPFNPERDRVSINGHVLNFLQGDNNVWP